MRRLKLPGILVLGALIVASLWWISPPAIVRSLPPGESLVYLNFAPLRGALQDLTASRAPGYAAFVRESGFDYLRDLDAIAISMRGNPARPSEATAILKGRFGPRFEQYLQQHARAQELIGGARAYIFPGWARPQQLLTVVPLSGSELLVTNAADPGAVVAHARRWSDLAPPLWRAGNNWRLLVGYAGFNVEQLEAERALDGGQEPWQGIERVEARLRAGTSGATLELSATGGDPNAAANARAWVTREVAALRPLLRQDAAGRPTLRALLDRLQSGQVGNRAWFRIHVEPATLRHGAQSY
ncbi:MAG: hypothetical protein ACRD1Y_09305 [Terriglobales bacterium]